MSRGLEKCAREPQCEQEKGIRATTTTTTITRTATQAATTTATNQED
jgi:hypothetical protein